jgi:hypothetical protein
MRTWRARRVTSAQASRISSKTRGPGSKAAGARDGGRLAVHFARDGVAERVGLHAAAAQLEHLLHVDVGAAIQEGQLGDQPRSAETRNHHHIQQSVVRPSLGGHEHAAAEVAPVGGRRQRDRAFVHLATVHLHPNRLCPKAGERAQGADQEGEEASHRTNRVTSPLTPALVTLVE